MRNKLLLIVVGILLGMPTYASEYSDCSKPKWMQSLPIPSNSSFIYVIETAIATSLPEARQECWTSLLQDAGFEKGVSVKSDYKTMESENSIVVNGISNNVTETYFIVNSYIKGKETELQGYKVDEYWERRDDGKYYLTTLYARSKVDCQPSFDKIELTTKYGTQGLWRSAIIPGWGQFYKGSTLKGSLFLSGTAVIVGGIIYTDCMRQDYMNKIHNTHNPNTMRTYKTRADNFAIGRNICIGGLAVLYVYNLVDAIVAPGSRHIMVRKNANGSGYAVVPTINFDGSLGIAAQITF